MKEKNEAWPGHEVAKAFDFGIDSNVPFKDNSVNIIKSILKNSNKII